MNLHSIGGTLATTEAQKRANRKYKAAHSKEVEANFQKIQVRLHKESDKDIISKLESVPSKQGYIKNLIRADISDKTTD